MVVVVVAVMMGCVCVCVFFYFTLGAGFSVLDKYNQISRVGHMMDRLKLLGTSLYYNPLLKN